MKLKHLICKMMIAGLLLSLMISTFGEELKANALTTSITVNFPEDLPGWHNDGEGSGYDTAGDFRLPDSIEPISPWNDETGSFGNVVKSLANEHQRIVSHVPRNSNILEWRPSEQAADFGTWKWGGRYYYTDDYGNYTSRAISKKLGELKTKSYTVIKKGLKVTINGSMLGDYEKRSYRTYPQNHTSFNSAESTWTKHPMTSVLKAMGIKAPKMMFEAYYAYDYVLHFSVKVDVEIPTGKATIHYKDKDTGATIGPDAQTSNYTLYDMTAGASVSKQLTDSNISSYKFATLTYPSPGGVIYSLDSVDPLPMITVDKPNPEFTIWYKRPAGTGSLVVKYVDKDTGKTISPNSNPINKTITDTSSYTYTNVDIAPYQIAIPNYTFTDYSPAVLPTISTANSSATLTMRYTKDPTPPGNGSVTVSYMSGTTSISPDDYFASVPIGDHTYNAKTIAGYTLQGAESQTVTVASGQSYTVTFNYTINQVTYEPPTARIIAPATVYEGDPFLVDGSSSSAAPGCKIDQYIWSSNDPENVLSSLGSNSSGIISFMNAGTYTLNLTVHQSPIENSQPVQLANEGWSKPVSVIIGGKK